MPRHRTLSLCCVLLAVATTASASAASDQAFARMVARLNRASPIEPAGSHGSIGFSIGAGMRETSVEGRTSQQPQGGFALLPTSDDSPTKIQFAEAHLIKGLSLPVDLGVTGGRALDHDLTRAGGYLQWTLYEAFAMPALAVRLGHNRLFGTGGTVQTTAGQALLSYGFLRYFTLYGGLGGDYIQTSTPLRSDDGLPLSDSQSGTADFSWYENSRFYGARILVYPPMGALSAEAIEHEGEPLSLAIKISAGM